MKFTKSKIYILFFLIFLSYLYAYLPEYDYIIGEVISSKASAVLKNSGFNYEAKNAMDGDLATAWCFKGSSGKEYIEITFKPTPADGIIILNGLGKTRSLYYANNRVKDFELEIIDRENKKYKYIGKFKDNSCGHPSLNPSKPISFEQYVKEACSMSSKECQEAKNTCTMDSYDYGGEKLVFKNIFKTTSICIEKIILKVKNVYQGKVYNDTCISEINILIPSSLSDDDYDIYTNSICGF